MVIAFEISGPWRSRPISEHYGPLHRWVWGFFSVSYIAAEFNAIQRAIRKDERERIEKETKYE